jgi:hypothetical protein
MLKAAIEVLENGRSVGFVGKTDVSLDRTKSRLSIDHPVVSSVAQAMHYVSRGAAENFAKRFEHKAAQGVTFQVVDFQQAEAHARELDGNWFWCRPMGSHDNPDPTSGRDWTDPEGNKYWCVPHEKEFGRRYDSEGPIDPNRVE